MLTEPVTMLTDYGLGTLCAFLGWRLWVGGRVPGRMGTRFWAFGMGALALAAFAGGTVHGWALVLTSPMLLVLWMIVGLAIGLASGCFFAGTLVATVAAPMGRWLMAVPCLQFVGYAVWMIRHSDFRYVIYNYGVVLAVISFLQLYDGFVRKASSAGWILAGIAVSFLAASVQLSGISLHHSFTQNDLYHLVQAVGVAVFYRGASLLQDR